jgi:hypothetical protein
MTQRLRFLVCGLMLATGCVAPFPAIAGPYADDMAKCLVKSTNAADRTVFLKWLFATMALNPDVASMVNISPEQRDEMNKNAATLFQRLLTESCRSETRQALQYEGPATLQYAFQIFGQAATRDLVSNPRVAEGMKDLGKYLDEAKLKSLESDVPSK